MSVSTRVCATGIRSVWALNAANLPTKKLMHAMCIHALAAVTRLDKSVMMPSSCGKNWGLPVASPSAKDPGIMSDRVSGDQDAQRSARYATHKGTRGIDERRNLAALESGRRAPHQNATNEATR
mmetsp:Transcript_4386/g.19916  ORF Transcript_4386/g.19916 Transcript_4386/m.19916 type:complete len:124 (+) Transcript_4386:274-645(+)